jgi:Cys-tRNA(Pro) deacylase
MSPDVVANVKRLLEEKDIDYDISEHEPVYTSEKAAQVRGVGLRTGVKALILKTREGRFLLALVRADKRADLERIAQMEGTKHVRLASPEEVLRVTGCEIGSVPPFGHVTKLRTYFDKDILENEYVNFNAGLHTVSVRMKAGDLRKVVGGIVY